MNYALQNLCGKIGAELGERGSKLRLDEPEPCRKHWTFGSLTEEAPDGGYRGFIRSSGEMAVVRETITTAQLSHLTEINQPTLNEKRALTAGGQGSYRSPEKESIG